MTEQISLDMRISEINRPVEYDLCTNCPVRIRALNEFFLSLGELVDPDNRVDAYVDCLPNFRNPTQMHMLLHIHVPKRDPDGSLAHVRGRDIVSFKFPPTKRQKTIEVTCPGLAAE